MDASQSSKARIDEIPRVCLNAASGGKVSLAASLWRAMPFISPYRWQLVVAGAAFVVTAGIFLLLVQAIRITVDRGLLDGSAEALNFAVAAVLVAAAILAVGTYFRFYWMSWLAERISADIRAAVYEHLIDLHPGYFERTSSGEIQSRLTTDTTLVQNVISGSMAIALQSGLTLIGAAVLLVVTNPKLTAIVFIGVPLVVVPMHVLGRQVRRLSRSSQDRVADVGSYAAESLHNIKTVHAFNHQEEDKRRFARHVEDAFRTALTHNRSRSFMIAVVIALLYAAVAGMFWIGGRDVIRGDMTLGELTSFVVYALMVVGSVGGISQVFADLQRAAGATERLSELLRARSDIVAPPEPLSLDARVKGAIAFKDVSFRYPLRPEIAAVDRVRLSVRAGASLALVGPSGAGKSTLFELLLRFYDPQEGSIELDGCDISRLDPRELRRHIALVSQSPAIFADSVRENIRYGRPTATDAEVLAAAERACVSEFVERLPQGYDSFLGEAGVLLSGGQRQRIAIARAILKDAAILLLDEATNALDAESERSVQQALRSVMKERTTLVIAHRLATVINVDAIAVMKAGRVVACGSHEQLLEQCELYARLAALQFGRHASANGTAS